MEELLSGRVNIWRIVKIYAKRPVLTLESRIRNLARRLRIHLPYDLGWELEEIVARGVQVVFVFARGEPGMDLLKIEAGSSVKRLGAQVPHSTSSRAPITSLAIAVREPHWKTFSVKSYFYEPHSAPPRTAQNRIVVGKALNKASPRRF